MSSNEQNEQIVRECLQWLQDRKLARIPPSVAELIRQKNLPFEGDYDDLEALVWKIINDPVAENTYKLIMESDEEQVGTPHANREKADMRHEAERCTLVAQQRVKAVGAITFCSQDAKAALSLYTAG